MESNICCIPLASSPSQALRASSPKGGALGKTGNFTVLPRPLPLRKDFPRPGEDVAQRQKGECGIA